MMRGASASFNELTGRPGSRQSNKLASLQACSPASLTRICCKRTPGRVCCEAKEELTCGMKETGGRFLSALLTKEAIMHEQTIFSAKEWIAASLISAEGLKPETLDAVESFTLMWNIFEGLVCDNSATISRLEKLSAEIVGRRRRQEEIEQLFTYFKNCYCAAAGPTADFDGLHLRATDRKEFIEAVLRDEKSDYESRLLALMIILYKIRNNLFHGLKSLDRLNSQAFNLNMACKALATIIEAHGRHFKRERYAG
jgi:hypothetical protein